jgi:hypothetical protein
MPGYELSSKYIFLRSGFTIDPIKFGFDTLSKFFLDVSQKNENIFVENGRIKLRSRFETESGNLAIVMKFHDEKLEDGSVDLENEVFHEIKRLNLQVKAVFFRESLIVKTTCEAY